MATVLRLRFPGRRYHATPWGHHVNEGQVEWPPSPWRLLRALLATGFLKLGWAKEGPPDVALRLIERLAPISPTYYLPPVVFTHSRHYVDAAGKKPLIFDAWAQVDEGAIEVAWDIDLPLDEHALLTELASLLGYLGRAESWVEAALMPDRTQPPNCEPDTGSPPGVGMEAVRVLAPMGAKEYATWRAARVAAIEAAEGGDERTRSTASKKRLATALLPYPKDLIASLCVETSALQAQGWSAAPGSREQIYYRVNDLSVGSPLALRRSSVDHEPLALLSVSTPSRSTSALPPLYRVFPQGRLLHMALASVVGKQMNGDPDLALQLLGYTQQGKAQHGHQHAHLLYLDLDDDQRLDHVLVYVPTGLSARAQEALLRVRRTYMKGGVGELQVALAGVGNADTLRAGAQGAGPRMGQAMERVLGPKGGAMEWESDTPYVAPRLLKSHGKKRLERQVQDECQQRGLPPVEVREVPHDDERWRSLRRHVLYDKRGDKVRQPPWSGHHVLVLRFARPFDGPLCLGYGAHAGLGQFKAVIKGAGPTSP